MVDEARMAIAPATPDAYAPIPDDALEAGQYPFSTGETRLAPAGWVFTGDIAVLDSETGEFRFLGSGIDDVGTVVVLDEEAVVYAEFGCWSTKNLTAEQLQAEMLKSGCEDGCGTAPIRHWPADFED